jgi:biotin carboxyl carrier protein
MVKALIRDQILKVESIGSEYKIDGISVPADFSEFGKGKFHVIMNNRSYVAEVISSDKENKLFEIKIGNKIIPVQLRDKYDELLQEIGIDVVAGKKVNDIKAPMPGMVLQVLVEKGQPIKKGDAIVVLEAMKMENILKSPADGIINKVHVNKGDKVEKNQVMVIFD